jgi:hypothetical protein
MKRFTQTQLHALIERYFNAETSVAEERDLRLYLAKGKYSLTEQVEEALAVMSVQQPRARSKANHYAMPMRWIAAAAVIGIIAVIGVKHQNSVDTGMNYAYVGGKYTNDAQVLNSLMTSQVNELAEQMEQSQQAIDSPLSELSEVMRQQEIN